MLKPKSSNFLLVFRPSDRRTWIVQNLARIEHMGFIGTHGAAIHHDFHFRFESLYRPHVSIITSKRVASRRCAERLGLVEREMPAIQPDAILIAVLACGVCLTDLHIAKAASKARPS